VHLYVQRRTFQCSAFQLVDMDAGQKEWLAEHLGHEFNVHKNNYVLQEPIIELAKISRLLIAIETGDAAMFVGKKLQDIATEGSLTLSLNFVLGLIAHKRGEFLIPPNTFWGYDYDMEGLSKPA